MNENARKVAMYAELYNPKTHVVHVDLFAELETELAEARARIDHLERVVDEMQNEQALICAEGQSITELVAAKDKQLAEAQAEIEALKRVNVALNEEIKIQRAYVTGRDNTIERKERLIEQMREALKLALPEARSTHCENTIKAALAAERGE